MNNLYDFVRESNKIEGILREPTKQEIEVAEIFMKLSQITVEDMCNFVSVYEPEALLRDKFGMDVKVGNHIAPIGEPEIRQWLLRILWKAEFGKGSPYKVHKEYEYLHPFTDCNGRSGRMLWAWQMQEFPLEFLHTWYCQSLEAQK